MAAANDDDSDIVDGDPPSDVDQPDDAPEDDAPPWPPDFPQVVVHGPWHKLKAMSDYRDAKAGDTTAAQRVVERFIDPHLIIDMGRRCPDAMVVAVHAVEATGRNKLPIAYAHAIADIADLSVDDAIVQMNVVGHTGADALHRLISVPRFDGPVQSGRDHIVVDDVVTSGSSLAALRHYIEGCGGRVLLATTLADADPAESGAPSAQLAVTRDTLLCLTRKLDPADLQDILEEYGIAPSIAHLTESQGAFLLRFADVDALRDRLASARQEGR